VKLRDLEAKFLQYRVEEVPPDIWIDGMMHPDGKRTTLPYVETLAEAHGISFLCPICFHTSHHSVICWFEDKVPDSAKPGPGRWNPVGTGLDDLTFVPGKKTQSVQLLGGCNWHGFVTNGDAS
jgi:hypothetical protein